MTDFFVSNRILAVGENAVDDFQYELSDTSNVKRFLKQN